MDTKLTQTIQELSSTQRIIILRKRFFKTTYFTIVTNNIKYLGVTLTKQGKDLNDKNIKSLNKEIKEDRRRWKDLPWSLMSRINIVKKVHLAKHNLRIQCNPHHNSNSFLHRDRKSNSEIYLK